MSFKKICAAVVATTTLSTAIVAANPHQATAAEYKIQGRECVMQDVSSVQAQLDAASKKVDDSTVGFFERIVAKGYAVVDYSGNIIAGDPNTPEEKRYTKLSLATDPQEAEDRSSTSAHPQYYKDFFGTSLNKSVEEYEQEHVARAEAMTKQNLGDNLELFQKRADELGLKLWELVAITDELGVTVWGTAEDGKSDQWYETLLYAMDKQYAEDALALVTLRDKLLKEQWVKCGRLVGIPEENLKLYERLQELYPTPVITTGILYTWPREPRWFWGTLEFVFDLLWLPIEFGAKVLDKILGNT
ncbi:MAG: hypothetical protein Q3972_08655 [Corynebacterium sp.]|nr:hypothetical protein [Corynebacterium sp.]